jgi:hypothetical protein
MRKNKIIAFKKPGEISEDPLSELLRSGARKLIADAFSCVSICGGRGSLTLSKKGPLRLRLAYVVCNNSTIYQSVALVRPRVPT